MDARMKFILWILGMVIVACLMLTITAACIGAWLAQYFFAPSSLTATRETTPTNVPVVILTATAPTPTKTATARPPRPTPMPTHTTNPTIYPLFGQTYTAWINGSPDTSGLYSAVWQANGWLYQPNLPPEGKRLGFVMSITLVEGRYTFSGVSCRLHLDVNRNGLGANNPKTVGYGNGLPFQVDTDGGQAWAFVVCDPTATTGYSIQWLMP